MVTVPPVRSPLPVHTGAASHRPRIVPGSQKIRFSIRLLGKCIWTVTSSIYGFSRNARRLLVAILDGFIEQNDMWASAIARRRRIKMSHINFHCRHACSGAAV